MDDFLPEPGTFKYYCFWFFCSIVCIPMLVVYDIIDTVCVVVFNKIDFWWYRD